MSAGSNKANRAGRNERQNTFHINCLSRRRKKDERLRIHPWSTTKVYLNYREPNGSCNLCDRYFDVIRCNWKRRFVKMDGLV